jgi:hypothetical protein
MMATIPVTHDERPGEDGGACAECGGPIPRPQRGPRGLYCSPACKQRAYRRRVREEREAYRARLATRPPTR